MIEFAARLKGQAISTLVARALRAATADATTRGGWNGEGGRNWAFYWDDHEGIRTINLARDPETFPPPEEEELLRFVKSHLAFFSETGSLDALCRIRMDVLWPDILRYLEVWKVTRATDPFRAGRNMATALGKAGITPPPWPPDPSPGP